MEFGIPRQNVIFEPEGKNTAPSIAVASRLIALSDPGAKMAVLPSDHNRDHPLYQKEARKKDTYVLHVARLLTQEICLMKDPRNPRQAFQRQSKLLRDALVDTDENPTS